MMRRSRHLLCMALIMCILVSLAPMTAMAVGEESSVDTANISAVIGDAVQSMDDGAEDAQVAEDLGPGDPIEGDLYPSHFLGKDSCIEELYDALRLRKNEIYLYYCTDEELTEADLDELFLTAAQWDFHADGGDYLLCSIADYGYYAEVIEDGGLNYYIIGYAVAYFTTLEQEQALEAKIEELRPTIIGDAVNDYQKIKAIHDYIVKNVEVDIENASNVEDLTVHSAYAALFNGKATAQAYPLLFQRMARQYGLGSRIIIGTVQGEVFMWNILRSNEVWYNVNIIADDMDSTDAYFMKGSTDFPDGHQPAEMYLTEEFMRDHPMSETALNPEKESSGKAGEKVTWYYNALTNELVVTGSGRMSDEPKIGYIQANTPNLIVEDGVTYIGKYAFANREFDKVVIAGSVTEIGPNAFDGSAINTLVLNKGLKKIDDYAFSYCSNLTEVKLPSTVESIGAQAFYNVSIAKAEISANVKHIGANAFDCENFEGYVVDEKNPVYSSYEGALYSKDLTELLSYKRNGASVVLPDFVKVIGEGAFSNKNLVSLYIPPSVTVIKKQAIPMNGSIEGLYYGGTQEQWDAITIEEGNDCLTMSQLQTETHAVSGNGWYLDLSNGAMNASGTISSYEGVFAWDPWRDKITSVEFNEHTYWFESGCFKDCVNLKTIRFNSDHLAIFGDAFAGCTSLTDVYYNESESKWKEDGYDKAFPDSPNLTVHYKALPTSGSWGDDGKWVYDEQTGLLVISGVGTLTRDNRGWEDWSSYVKTVIIEPGISEIGNSAFYGCDSLIRIVIPEGVTAIGEYAFHAASPNDITIPVSLQSVSAQALMSGGLNTDIHYKGTKAQWNAITFAENNEGFTMANIHFETTCDHDMVIDMGKAATCTEEGMTMSKHCTICDEVFAVARTLPKAPHEYSYDGMGYKCFNCGTQLDESTPKSGEFGNGFTWEYRQKQNSVFTHNELMIHGQGEMPNYADASETPWSMWTTDIEYITVYDGVTSVGDRAFSGCVNLKGINLGDDVSKLGKHALSNCVSLMEVYGGKSIAVIGENAFDGCSALKKIALNGAVETIGKNAFKGCSGLIAVDYKGSEAAWNAVEIGSGNDALRNAEITFSQPVDYVENPFTDVANTDWFANPVLWAFDTGVTGGTSATTFGPNNFCTRAQVVTFLYAAAGKPEVTTTDNPFEDVADDAWYLKPVLWAVENGITGGTSPTTFGPDNYCTRAQVVTFLYAAAGKPEITASSTFDDVADTDWYAKPVIWAKENDVTGGISATEFGPNQTCTRAQVVTFLYKVYG